LAKEHANCIHYERYTEYEKTIYYVKKSQEELISVREFQLVNEHRLFPGRLVSSYSSLQRKYGQDSTFDAVQRDEHTELPDDPLDKFEIAPGISNVSAEQKAIMNFPKGAHTGNFWHELLETVDFDDPSNWNQIVKETGMKYGITNISDVETLARLIRNTVESPIGKHPTFSSLNPHLSHLKLAGLRRSQTLREMEFLYPYSVSELHSLIDELFDGFPYSENISGLANIKKQDTVNLLTGLVDLVFESNGMYFILDYKSNHLGDSFKSYAHSEIELDIRINGYMIQYHLYTAALIKYLSKQIRDFSYERHFGGVFYLYWRGLNSIDTNGVFFDKPSWEMIAPFTGNLSVDPNISVEANIGGTIKSDIRLGAS
jgi:exodeoxyribonuclease V beta subunit